ncbi:MAG: GNAT family N-acetyltransferase [Chloroflexi bacterium]|nr:GNAT family N-acetyltransferase [Chloroflexota bacterium]
MRIRKASTQDAAAIARVHVNTWRTTYAGILPADFLAGLSYANSESNWSQALTADRPGESVFVAETDAGEIVGFANGAPERESDPLYRGEIYSIYLLAAYQRMGVGRRLFTALAQRLRQDGLESFLLWVLKDNLLARRFYESLGGTYLTEKTITIGETDLIEVSYGWRDIVDVTGEA